MRKLLFLSRVIIICNVCFVFTFFLNRVPFLANGVITSTVLVLGNILAIVLNILFHVICLVLLLMGRRIIPAIPAWMIAFNFTFLIIQILLLIK